MESRSRRSTEKEGNQTSHKPGGPRENFSLNSAEISEGGENMRTTREELCGFLLLITRHWEIPLGQTADVTQAAREDYLAGPATSPVCVCVCVRV